MTCDYSDVSGLFALDRTCPGLERSGVFSSECYEKYRPTVAIAAVVGPSHLLLVQSSKRADTNDKPSWLIPQGGVDRGQSIYQALANHLWQEIGMKYSLLRLRQMQEREELVKLGTFTNTIRQGQEKPKHILVVAMRMFNPNRIQLNNENAKQRLVEDPYLLWQLLKDTRPLKSLAIFNAVNEARAHGLIDWSCEGVIREFSAGNQAAA